MIPIKRLKGLAITKTFAIIVLATIVSDWVTSWIPVDKLPVSNFWRVMIARSLTSLLALIGIKVLYPQSLRRLKGVASRKRLLIGLVLVTFLTLPGLMHSQMTSFRASQILEGLIFALFIGFDEEFFSRGFIYACLEGYGVLVATVISSIHFGLLHLGNIPWGGQSVSYTLAQVISASAFGYLAVGLMLYTGSIWIPILLHGLSDSPMQFEGAAHYTKAVTGHPDWVGTILNAVTYIAIGWVLIQFSKNEMRSKLTGWAGKFSFVYLEEPNPPTDR